VARQLRSILAGDLPRRVLLLVWVPLIALFYFGILAVAASFCPQTYDWRRKAISKLLYPGYDPEFHRIASLGVALTGLLMLPVAGYIRRRLRGVAPRVVQVGASALALGAVGLILAGLIVSHPIRGTSAFPWLHEILARTAAVALGAGVIALWACATKAYLGLKRRCEWRWLTISWTSVMLPALSIALLRAAAAARFHWSNPIYQMLESPALWHLGLWEWLGSGAIFLFLLSAALFLPECSPGN
jgi:hypothetical protein